MSVTSPSFTQASYTSKLIWLIAVLASLPLILSLLWFNYATVVLAEQRRRLGRAGRHPNSRKTILVTGASNPYGLDVARAFHRCGHRVIGVDAKYRGILSTARRSRAIAKHYNLPELSAVEDETYLARYLAMIAKHETVDLWIDCSHDLSVGTIVTARQHFEDSNVCACIAVDKQTSQYFKSAGSLHALLKDRGLPATEVHQVKSRADIHNVLNSAQGRKQYLLKSPENRRSLNPQTLLPRRTLSQTYHEVSLVRISADSRMVLEESVDFKTVYHCSAVVVHGRLNALWAHQINDSETWKLNDSSAMCQALRTCTARLVRELGHGFSGNLTLLFVLDEKVTQTGVAQQVSIAEGTFRTDEKFAYARDSGGRKDLVDAYLGVFQNNANGTSRTSPLPASEELPLTLRPSHERYWLPETTVSKVLKPCLHLLQRRTSLRDFGTSIVTYIETLAMKHEAYYDFWDPLPAFWQYSVVLASTLWQTSQAEAVN